MLEYLRRAVLYFRRRIQWIRMPEAIKRQVVAHEAGHAFAAWHLETIESVLEVTILPVDRFHGYTITSNRHELLSVDEMFQVMIMSMAGMAGETLLLGEIRDGGQEDALQVVAHWLMINHGLSVDASYPIAATLIYALMGDDEVRRAHADAVIGPILAAFYEAAKALLKPRLEGVRKLAVELRRRKSMKHSDLERLLGPRKYVTVEELFHTVVDSPEM
jgi:ATP-dependent Zn protease